MSLFTLGRSRNARFPGGDLFPSLEIARSRIAGSVANRCAGEPLLRQQGSRHVGRRHDVYKTINTIGQLPRAVTLVPGFDGAVRRPPPKMPIDSLPGEVTR